MLGALKTYSCHAKEFTIEANPESLDEDKLSLFFNEGVNRISIGVQSFNDNKLKRLGRIHDAADAIKAIELSKKYFNDISIDLIFGVSSETLEGWKDDLKEAVSFPVDHISCYGLTHDKDLKPTYEETMAEMYKYSISYLEDEGFKQYEISNFSKPGHRCRHNMNYWDGGPYKGLGPSAVSYLNGSREENIASVEEYIRMVNDKRSPVASKESLSPDRRAKELAAIKIRTNEGIGLKWFKDKTGFDLLGLEKEAISKLAEDGLIEYNDKCVKLAKKGLLFCDVVSSAFL